MIFVEFLRCGDVTVPSGGVRILRIRDCLYCNEIIPKMSLIFCSLGVSSCDKFGNAWIELRHPLLDTRAESISCMVGVRLWLGARTALLRVRAS
jgi:hypothetical protein